MSSLLTSRITVRGAEYLVQEMTGKQMAGLRKLIAVDKPRMEAWVCSQCCLEPKIASEEAAMQLPQIVLDKVSTEILRLTAQGSEGDSGPPEAKNV